MSTLVDSEIRTLVDNHGLITDFKDGQLVSCRYNIRAGKAFESDSGKEMVLSGTGHGKHRRTWTIKPSGTLVVMTRESFKLPNNIFATYGQLNGLARNGIYLMNISIVEPGYSGYLSCFLVNFSKNDFDLCEEDDVAKICFHQLAKTPTKIDTVVLDEKKYVNALVKNAKVYPNSFMDIGEVEQRAVKKATRKLGSTIAWGGGFIAVLLIWSSLEPLFSKYLWERVGVSTYGTQVEHQKIQNEADKAAKDAENASKEAEKASKDAELIAKQLDLEKEIQEIKKQLEESAKKP